jgi:flagellar hook-associated protein FlgK
MRAVEMDVGSASGSAVTQGLIGMQRSQAEISKSAQQIVKAGTTERDNPAENDVAESLVNIKAQAQVFNASAKIVKSADETIGTLLKTKA